MVHITTSAVGNKRDRSMFDEDAAYGVDFVLGCYFLSSTGSSEVDGDWQTTSNCFQMNNHAI